MMDLFHHIHDLNPDLYKYTRRIAMHLQLFHMLEDLLDMFCQYNTMNWFFHSLLPESNVHGIILRGTVTY